MNEKYLGKLRDPRWQRKRLEIMQRDEFMCQMCFDSEHTLNVHHNYYKSNADPWDYPAEALVTLCESCHQDETENRRAEEQTLLDVLRRIGFKAGHVNGLMSALYQTFKENPQFPDHWDWYLDKFILNFHLIAADVELLIAERKKKQIEAETKEAPDLGSGAVLAKLKED